MKKLIALLLLLLPSIAFSEGLPKELSMTTEVGKIAITVEDCPVKNNHGFVFKAYATEWKAGKEIVHNGCWNKDANVVHIWFYEEQPSIVASYKDHYFKPEKPL